MQDVIQLVLDKHAYYVSLKDNEAFCKQPDLVSLSIADFTLNIVKNTLGIK